MSSLYGESDVENEEISELSTLGDLIHPSLSIEECIEPFILSYLIDSKPIEFLEIQKEIDLIQNLTLRLDTDNPSKYFELIKAIQIRINLKNNNPKLIKAILKSQEKFQKHEESLFREHFYQLVHQIISSNFSHEDLKSLLTKKIIQNFIDSFKSEVNIERELIKRITHLIYSKFINKRKFIRKSLNNYLEYQLYESQTKGISEVLELFDCFIKGFMVPLKNEHLKFFNEILLPLHKLKLLVNYSRELTSCCKSFISKDESLLSILMNYIIKHWPVRNPDKIVLLIEEFLKFMRSFNFKAFDPVASQFFEVILKSSVDCYEKISRLAFSIISDEKFKMIYLNNCEILRPIINKILSRFKNSAKYESISWILNSFDSRMFEDGKIDIKANHSNEEVWKNLHAKAMLIDPDLPNYNLN